MTSKEIIFEPLDTLFFRDGRPYNKDEATQTDVASRFPPSPLTLVGAVRAAYARAMGWRVGDEPDWPAPIKNVLGDRAELNGLSFTGPFVFRSETALFPAPALLLREGGKPGAKEEVVARLRPGAARHCDLGNQVRLAEPETNAVGLKPLRDWITPKGLAEVLRGDIPDRAELVPESDLWGIESRVGISRDTDTRTTRAAAMYSAKHIRLSAGVNLRMIGSGLPDELDPNVMNAPQPVGGESRLCWLTVRNARNILPEPPLISGEGGKVNYAVFVITPAHLPRLEPGQHINQLPGHLVSACISRPQMWGGWSSTDRGPQPLRPLISPGSVLFMDADTSDVELVRQTHGTQIGERTQWGFGLVALGSWN